MTLQEELLNIYATVLTVWSYSLLGTMVSCFVIVMLLYAYHSFGGRRS